MTVRVDYYGKHDDGNLQTSEKMKILVASVEKIQPHLRRVSAHMLTTDLLIRSLMNSADASMCSTQVARQNCLAARAEVCSRCYYCLTRER